MSLSPLRRDAKWINGQWIPNALVPKDKTPQPLLSPREKQVIEKTMNALLFLIAVVVALTISFTALLGALLQ